MGRVTAIWLLSTKGRPREAQETIDACEATGMTSPGIVYVDETPYPKLRLPPNWTLHYERKWLSLQGSMSYVFERYPDATQYGWLADDTRPRTHGWDKKLEAVAGSWCLAYARDLWFSESPGQLEWLERGLNLSSGLCWGGELVRTVGWWALPGVKQAGIDMAWLDIARPFGLHRYRHDIVVEHLNWRTGKRPFDQGDEWTRGDDEYVNRDLAVKNQWYGSGEYRGLMRRMVDAISPGAVRPDHVEMAIRQSFADECFVKGALPAARLQRILAGGMDIDKLDGERADADQGQARVA